MQEHHLFRRLDVSHVVNYFHCDLRCPYCISDWDNQRGTRTTTPADVPADRERQILRRIAALPYHVHLTLSNTGEPLINRWLLDEVTRLCNGDDPDSHLQGLTLVTNLNASWARVVGPFLERTNTRRLALACSLHDAVLDADGIARFFDNCARARDRGALVLVIYIVRPGALADARAWKQRCDDEGLPFLPNAMAATGGGRGVHSAASPYTAEEIAAARELTETPHAHKLLFESRSTAGEPCGAGHRYVFVDSDGDAFPCFSMKDGPQRLGNVLDGSFAVRDHAMACPLNSCGCPNDNAALHIVDARYDRTIDHRYLTPKPGLSRARLEDGYRPRVSDVRRAFQMLTDAAASLDRHPRA